MDSFFIYLKAIAPGAFLFFSILFLFIQALRLWIKVQIKYLRVSHTQIKELAEYHCDELSDIKSELDSLIVSHGGAVPDDDPEKLRIDKKLKELKDELFITVKDVAEIDNKITLVETILNSFFGRLLGYIGNIDTPKERSRS